ncbi:hypothetical protein N0V83_003265 [Neocucurbitaria cava]|uniref:Uncharacterized protein n=1 Tax=Neocucurbitaria cava TaxID=798079 RepID=A0A9W9CNC5_9PLEO|nr:hypothetical protein N0V83_003265 [Neocucurbitaria cava]
MLTALISPEKMEALAKHLNFGSAASWYAYHIGYLAIMGLIKLSILAFYLSFATHRTFRILPFNVLNSHRMRFPRQYFKIDGLPIVLI